MKLEGGVFNRSHHWGKGLDQGGEGVLGFGDEIFQNGFELDPEDLEGAEQD